MARARRLLDSVRDQGPSGIARFVQHGVGWRYRRLRLRLQGPAAQPPAAKPKKKKATGPVISHQLAAAAAEQRLLTIGEHHPEIATSALAPDLAVAVVVPTFGDRAFLGDALKSVQNQTHTNFHCYVVDDASTDQVEAVFSQFASDHRFSLLRHGVNAGLAAARNTGLRVAREPLVQFLDADDMLTPWSLQCRVERMREEWDDPTVAGVHGQILQCPEETPLRDLSSWKQKPRLGTKDWANSNGESPFNVHAPLLRRSVVVGLGGFDESFLNGAEDWELWQRILRHGYRIRAAGRVVGAYRQRTSSMVRSHGSIHLRRADQLLSRATVAAIPNPSMVVGNGAMPVGRAQAAHVRAMRASVYAGIATAQAGSVDLGVDDQLLGFLDVDGTLWTRRDEMTASARAGLVRGLGLAAPNVKTLDRRAQDVLDSSAEEIARRLLRHVQENTDVDRLHSADAVDIANRRLIDVVLVAETAADVVELASIGQILQGAGVSVLGTDVDIVGGCQGAGEAWGASVVERVEFNALTLGACLPKVVVGRAPGGPVVLDLLESFSALGVSAFLLDEPDRGLTVVDGEIAPRLEKLGRVTADCITSEVGSSVRWAPGRSESGPGHVDPGFSHPRCEFDLASEESPLHEPSLEGLRRLQDAHRGQTAVIIGNGPSLNETDLSLLEGVPTFGVNSIFLADDRLPEPLTYYVVEDTAVFGENTADIKAYTAGTKLFPSNYLRYFEGEEIPDNTLFFRMNQGFYGRKTGSKGHPRFSTDASQRLFCGQSVTIINLQLAYWMGFSRVVLIGMDFSYVIPDDAEVNGNLIVSRSADPNHFHPDYFGVGKTWKDPKLDRVRISYRLAREMYLSDGREIVNATVGGNLEEFERLDLASSLRC